MEIRTHKYAKNAYPLVNRLKGSDIESKYRTLALDFPTMIMQSGLAQTIGFLKAKDKDKEEHAQLIQDMADLLGYHNFTDMHEAILKSNVIEYQLLTRQALDASGWLKRYTQALLEKNHRSTL